MYDVRIFVLVGGMDGFRNFWIGGDRIIFRNHNIMNILVVMERVINLLPLLDLNGSIVIVALSVNEVV